MTNPENETAVDPLVLRDKALNLRESVNSSKARLYAQRERLTRLRAEISALRALAESRPAQTVPPPAAAVPRVFRAPPAPAPILKEAVSDSAPAAASFKTDARARLWKSLPYAAILAAAVAVQMRPADRLNAGIPLTAAVPTAPAPSPAVPAGFAEDDGTDEALLLAHEFHLPGDERALSERLTSASNPPGSRPSWTAERTGERTYLVRYQPSGAALRYEFDVDLDTRRVEPTAETSELIAPQLASRR